MRILAVVLYNGTSYQGWQKQVSVPSIQETIEKVISKILNKETCIYGSGRTDAGVHALGQTFHFDIEKKNINLAKLKYSMNCLLPNDIYIRSLKKVNGDFHARFSLKEKTYVYKIFLGEKEPLNYDFVAVIPQRVDVDLFTKSLQKFIGKHNFQDFNSKPEDEEGFIRTINDIKVRYFKSKKTIEVTLSGDGFMRYMIRDIIGTALAISQGKEELTFIDEHLKNCKKREIVSYKSPANGLYLKEVKY